MIKNTRFETISPDRDTRALIYQQVEELEAFARGLGTIVVRVEQSRPGEGRKSLFAVTYVLSPTVLGLEIRAEAESVSDAILEAKMEAKRQLPSILNALADEGISLADTPETANPSPGWLH